MAVMEVHNDSKGWLVLWLEPLGEDRWLLPKETLTIRTDYKGDELAFHVSYHVDDEDRAAGIENIVVYIENSLVLDDVTDSNGNYVECGYQRPEEINDKWEASRLAWQARLAARGERFLKCRPLPRRNR